MNLFNRYISLFLIGTSPPAFSNEANISIDFGGWSKHFYSLTENQSKLIDYNESHDLIGIRYTSTFSDNGEYKYSIGFNKMNDSFGFDAYTVAAGAYYKLTPYNDFYIDTGLVIGAQYRSWIDETLYREVKFKKVVVPFLAPELKLGYKSFYASAMLVPNATESNGKYKLVEPTLFFQLGFNLININ